MERLALDLTPMQRLGLVDAVANIAAGRLSAEAYQEACLGRACRLEPRIQAFAHLALQPNLSPGPLAGIPVAIKDVIDTTDMPTAYGSAIFAGRRPERDAAIVGRIRTLGGAILGKTVTTEFAWRHPGPTRNPWNLAHSPGGSSSGSAAAVAAGIVPLAIGTQTLGSVIRPAAFCGVVGLKPSYGLLSREGVHPIATTLDHVGLFTRSVLDAAYALKALVQEDAPRAWPRPIDAEFDLLDERPLRLAMLRTTHWDRTDGEQQRLMADIVEVLRVAGAEIEEVVLSPALDRMWELARTILATEAAEVYRPLVAAWGDRISSPMRSLVAEAEAISHERYDEALSDRLSLQFIFASETKEFDAVVTPPAIGAAPVGLDDTGDPSFCLPWSFLGVPAVTIPVRLTSAGLPLGIQLVAQHGADARLLKVARWCEQIARHDAAPPLD